MTAPDPHTDYPSDFAAAFLAAFGVPLDGPRNHVEAADDGPDDGVAFAGDWMAGQDAQERYLDDRDGCGRWIA